MEITKEDIGRFVEDGNGDIEQITHVDEDRGAAYTISIEDGEYCYNLDGTLDDYTTNSMCNLTKFRDDVQENLDLLIFHGIGMGLL